MSFKTSIFALLSLGLLFAPVVVSKTSTSSLECLSRIIYNEGRGEPYKGKLAIAYVVHNRVKSSGFPNKYCDVIRQSNQFAYRKKVNKKSQDWKDSKRAAFHFLNIKPFIKDPTGGATYFLKKGTPKPRWMKKNKTVKKTAVIKNHVFFKTGS